MKQSYIISKPHLEYDEYIIIDMEKETSTIHLIDRERNIHFGASTYNVKHVGYEGVGINQGTLKDRLHLLGWSVERAFKTPTRKYN
jgi:hypothetical protein